MYHSILNPARDQLRRQVAELLRANENREEENHNIGIMVARRSRASLPNAMLSPLCFR
jgi:hypothetical protein